MIWGVGTGRCGTKSLAKELGGVHEPTPWLHDEPKRWYLSGNPDSPLELIIVMRAELDTPIVVDFKNSFMMRLILTIDIRAKFIWIIREPVDCIRSMMKGKWFQGGDNPGEDLIHPWSEWDKWQDSLDKCIWYYRTVNEHILKYNRYVSAVYFTEDLEAWDNKYPADIKYSFTTEELDYIHNRCDSIYKRARELKI